MEMMDGEIAHIGPGEGSKTLRAPGELVTFKVTAAQTGGAYSLFEVVVQPGCGPPPHVQHEEDERVYVLEGDFEFADGGETFGAGAGSLVYVPRGALHTYKNVGEAPGRLLVGQTPGGPTESFFEALGEKAVDEAKPLAVDDPPDVERIVALAARHGIEIPPPRQSSRFWGGPSNRLFPLYEGATMTKVNESNTTTRGLPRVSENPITGVRHTFLVTGDQTGGEYVRVRAELPPRAPGPPMHFHLAFTESFEVLEGRLDLYTGKRNHVVLTSGRSAFAPLKVPHRFWNSTDQTTVFEAEIRPAANFEEAIRAGDGMARDGKMNEKGFPKNLFELGLVYELSESYMTGMPLFLQRTIFGTLAKVARWRGYDPEFSEYTKPKEA